MFYNSQMHTAGHDHPSREEVCTDHVSPTSGVVQDETLVSEQEGHQVLIPVGTPAWHSWLETATAFTFKGQQGSFTAHKDRASNQRGGWYWYAYRRRHGHLSNLYLGTSEKLTLPRLQEAARTLAERADHPIMKLSTESEHASLPPGAFPTGDDPGLLTKLHLPRLPVQHVARPRLLALLEEGVQRPLTLVCAPAGCGKTTLLAEWARATSRSVVWLSLEAADNDPARFFSYLLAAFSRLDERIGTAMPTDRSWHTPDHKRVLTRLLNDLERWLQQDVVLILDDAQHLASEAVQAILLFLLEHLPVRLHLLIGTRVDPPLPLARLRAHNHVSELRSEELRFLSEEVGAFARAMDLTLSSEALALLQERTEGWIAGIQLLTLVLRGKGDAAAFLRASGGTHHFLLDYVREEVLRQQPLDLQRFLLRTCILERMSGPLCEAVTGEPDGQAKLTAVLRTNLFVSAFDDTQTWYRYHPLFAETLRTELQKLEPALVPELYRRASCWHEEHQSPEEACTYALLAGDLSRVAHLLAGLVPRLMQQGRAELVGRWLEQLPQAEIAASSELCIASSWMQYLRTPTPEYLEMLVEHMQQYVKQKPQEVVVSWVELQSELTLHRAFAAFDHHNIVRARTLLHEALRSLSSQEGALSRLMALRLKMMLSLTYRASGNLAAAEQVLLEICIPRSTDPYEPLNLAGVWYLAKLYEAQGQLRKRGALYERIFRALRPGTDLAPLPLVLLQGSRAALFYEWNRLPEALHVVQQVLPLEERMDPATFSNLSAFSRWTQTRIQLAQGQADTAREVLKQKEQPLVQIPIVEREEPTWAAIHARLALACDQREEAWQWASTTGKHFDDQPGPELSGAGYFEYVTLARILIIRGRREQMRGALAQALILLGHLRDLVVRLGLDGWFIEIQLLTALALQAQGKTRRALTVLAAVLTQAETEGYVRLFADEGLPLAHLLAQVRVYTTASPDYIQQLQDAIAATPPALSGGSQSEPYQPLHNPLSEREHEVLLLLAEGASNQQIADRLVISLNTAKLHVKHLLVKLSVTNRTQAVVRAHALHLF